MAGSESAALTLFYSVTLKEGLSGLIQSNVQWNVTITVHSRDRCTFPQEKTVKTNKDGVRIHLTAETVTQGPPILDRDTKSHYITLKATPKRLYLLNKRL